MVTRLLSNTIGLVAGAVLMCALVLLLVQRDGEKIIYMDGDRALFSMKRNAATEDWMLGELLGADGLEIPERVRGDGYCVTVADGHLVVRQYNLGNRVVPFDSLLAIPRQTLGPVVAKLPLLLVSATCGAILVTLVARGVFVKYHRLKRGKCVACGYDLRGLVAARCPECGLPFEDTERVAVAPEKSVATIEEP